MIGIPYSNLALRLSNMEKRDSCVLDVNVQDGDPWHK